MQVQHVEVGQCFYFDGKVYAKLSDNSYWCFLTKEFVGFHPDAGIQHIAGVLGCVGKLDLVIARVDV